MFFGMKSGSMKRAFSARLGIASVMWLRLARQCRKRSRRFTGISQKSDVLAVTIERMSARRSGRRAPCNLKMQKPELRAWVEIAVDRLRKNFALMSADKPASVRIAAVLKDEAYGHGAVEVAKI